MIRRELYDAIIAQDPKRLRAAIDAGDDVNGQDFGYPLPLSAAAGRWGCVDTVKVLLDAGADVNGLGNPEFQESIPWERSALVSAATYGHMDTFQLLLRVGADPLIVIGGGKTLLDWLIYSKYHGHREMAEMIRIERPEAFLDFWTAIGRRGF
ncbi:MAG: ankyrin repeat domain-containing protein [Syntrophorhabdales bacterium]|jgi:ankyrin repeat protein